MSESNLMDGIGNLSKPATVLIEKISNAIGGYFRPYQIRRVAKAEAEVEIIRAQVQIEITDIQRRAMGRFFAEEAMRQNNIESIARQAIPQLKDSAAPKDIEDDWITNFFDKCRIVSDKEMQPLWAKVLAGEANSPGKYSKRTVNCLGQLEKPDAMLFTSLCRFAWSINGDIVPLIYDVDEPIYRTQGITFDTLTHLDSIGPIVLNWGEPFTINEIQKRTTIFYYDSPLNLRYLKEGGNFLYTGMVCLTEVGRQLFTICEAKPIEGFYDRSTTMLRRNNSIFSVVFRQRWPVFFSAPRNANRQRYAVTRTN